MTPPAIDLSLTDVRQLFNSLDPSPFIDRDLCQEAVDYLVTQARAAGSAPLAMQLHLAEGPVDSTAAASVAAAIHAYFRRRSTAKRQELSDLFRTGRICLLIGVVFMAAAIFIGGWVTSLIRGGEGLGLAEESLIIGGWVALWRPMEIFLYDWWPIRSEARLYERLAMMPVGLVRGTRAAA